MTSQPDSPRNTSNTEDLLNVSLHSCDSVSHYSPPISSSAKSQDRFDVVITQGAYLRPRGRSPVFREPYNDEFIATLDRRLRSLLWRQELRHDMYHGAADEWLEGYTPLDILEKRKAEIKALDELYDATDSSEDDYDADNGSNTVDVIVDPISQYDPSNKSSANLQDSFDIVATQSACLLPRRRSPVFREPYDDKFITTLDRSLNSLSWRQELRQHKYHGAADEWPVGRTPPEITEMYEAEMKALDELWDASDNSQDDYVKDRGCTAVDARIGPGKTVTTPERSRKSHQAGLIPTPPLSTQSPLTTPHRWKRRRISEEDDEKKERPAKKQISSAKEVSAEDFTAIAKATVPNISQQETRKRQKVCEEDDDEEKEHPVKTHVSSAEEFSTLKIPATAKDGVPNTSQQEVRKRRRALDVGGEKEW
ncbi:hypothetical protein MMC25_003221 [Agyrium rufum]|nr:hypothetical protein [Agyrium rufum]